MRRLRFDQSHELDLVRTLPDASHCFLIKHGNDSVVARLNLSGMPDLLTVLSGRERFGAAPGRNPRRGRRRSGGLATTPSGPHLMAGGSCPAPSPDDPLVRSLLGTVDCNVRDLVHTGYTAIFQPGSAISGLLTALLTIYVAIMGYRLLLGPNTASGVRTSPSTPSSSASSSPSPPSGIPIRLWSTTFSSAGRSSWRGIIAAARSP